MATTTPAASRSRAGRTRAGKAAPKKHAAGKTSGHAASHPAKGHRWSQRVTETSDALDLKPHVFEGKDPKAIARSLKSSAEHSERRKSDPYRSAMSMLTFYINRAGAKLPATQKKILESAKDELRKLFHRPPRKAAAAKG